MRVVLQSSVTATKRKLWTVANRFIGARVRKHRYRADAWVVTFFVSPPLAQNDTQIRLALSSEECARAIGEPAFMEELAVDARDQVHHSLAWKGYMGSNLTLRMRAALSRELRDKPRR